MDIYKHESGAEISYIAQTPEERKTIEEVLKDYVKGRTVINKSYTQFNGRNLLDYIDDSTKRWNGYVPEASPLLEKYQSRVFFNWTRQQVIMYLSKVALNLTEPKFVAVNKKTGIQSKTFANVLKDLNQFSLNEENGDARFLESGLEATTKGTVIKYEGYRRQEKTVDVPVSFDAVDGKIKTKKETRVIFDNCYQEIVPLEDFYISNPYQPDVQKQPFVIWRKITTKQEAELEYGNYKNFDLIPETAYLVSSEPTTFYRNTLQTELGKDQVEIIKWYNPFKFEHVVIINGVLIYDGPIPFKDGKIPFAKGIFEPFGAGDFFWGMSLPAKIQNDQDLRNTLMNMMVDKTYGSLVPFALSSDLDDLIEDEYLQPNKIRKVGDISKWSFQNLPGVTGGEMDVLEMAMQMGNENAGNMVSAGLPVSSSGKQPKMTARQAMLNQQVQMQMLAFSMSYLEDFERDRTDLRIKHILQFYSIPKIEKITGKNGKEMEKLVYREVRIPNTKLSNGKDGERILKLMGSVPGITDKQGNPNPERQKLQNDLSVTEQMGHIRGVTTEVLAIDINTFTDYNFDIQIIKNSSYMKTSVLDQAQRQEFANWRLSLAQVAPLDAPKLISWVEEPYDIDPSEFELPAGTQANPQQQAQQAAAGQQAPKGKTNSQATGSKLGTLNAPL